MTSLIALFFSLSSTAHTIVLSGYMLEYKNGQWELASLQRTRVLENAIYRLSPDLKGVDLNSEAFHEATAAYLKTSLSLKHEGKTLPMVPLNMNYNGLSFESTFVVEGLPQAPSFLTIKAKGYEGHKGFTTLFRVILEKEGHQVYLNSEQNLATFDFKTQEYSFTEKEKVKHYSFVMYVIALTVLIGIVLKVFASKRKKEAVSNE
ncbi:MAG: hypothetical protein AAGA66_18705 [Bacteroidota bacterium]